ncbi:MAG: hypothetical protein E3J41_07415 [Candidatus Cloacimonadota bacterium]|nr:MAG: hypothetical protein E3J41_07415 [Candidatus Cloacimonadota bacterium]
MELSNHILSLTQSEEYLKNSQKQAKVHPVRYNRLSNGVKKLERKFDQLVYKLYGLTEEEIKIVEGKV